MKEFFLYSKTPLEFKKKESNKDKGDKEIFIYEREKTL